MVDRGLTGGMGYVWRRLLPDEREELLLWRKERAFPWHTPPHLVGGLGIYHVSAACYEHFPHIGSSPQRIQSFCDTLLEELRPVVTHLHAWCVLPNHYHLLVNAPELRFVTAALGKLHGRTSRLWNKEETARDRQVWHASSDRFVRNERHFWTSMNYIHHNPVKHGYAECWQDWPFGSAIDYLQGAGVE